MSDPVQLPNPKMQFGLRKPCLSKIPMAVLIALSKVDASEYEPSCGSTSKYIDAIMFLLIVHYDFHVDRIGVKKQHPVLVATVLLMNLMYQILNGMIVDDRPVATKLDFAVCCKMQTNLLEKYKGKKCAEPFLANMALVSMEDMDVGEIPCITSLHFDVLELVAVAMQEGALKYGDHNYRCTDAKILISTYIDATFRHLVQFHTFHEDIDVESDVHHIVKAIASKIVLCDSIVNNYNAIDDRPLPCSTKTIAFFLK